MAMQPTLISDKRPQAATGGPKKKKWTVYVTIAVRALAVMMAIAAAAALLVYADVRSYGRPIYHDPNLAPKMPVAIVFGAGFPVIEDRVAVGVALYKAGKVKKLLMSGDHGRPWYDEPDEMKREAMVQGVPARDIVCDYAGFRTLDTLVRARSIFGVDRAALVSQGYHLPRAMFLARQLGLTVVGVDATRRSYGPAQEWWDVREIGATEEAWWDIYITHRRPKYLGKKEPIYISCLYSSAWMRVAWSA
jgi:vancomycin permeability regulator SanA